LAREPRDIIWAAGFKFKNTLPKVANNFPEVKFAVVDTNLGGNIPSNVSAIIFKENEAAFLIGVVAGLTTKTNQVGGIGGIYGELIEKFRTGYIQGVQAVNPKAEVKWVYADSFTDSAKGRSLANSMYNSGIDVIFHAAGGVGKGVFDEVKTREAGKYWVIGVDQDQSRLAPQHTLTSLLKRLDVVVFDLTKKMKEGQFEGGKEVAYGLDEGALDIVNSRYIRPDVKKKVQEYREKIKSGAIKVSTKVPGNR
jgi:basic membrane protein A